MSELTKKLHILKNGATEEETVTLYSTEEECTEPNLKLKIDGAMAYAKLGDVTDAEASALRVYRNSDGVTYAVLKTAEALIDYWVDANGEKHFIGVSKAKNLPDGEFTENTNMVSVSFPSSIAIGNPYASGYTTIGAFSDCNALTGVDLPNATFIGTSTFLRCFALTDVNIPNATEIGYGAFQYCTHLTNIDLPQAVTLRTFSFAYCSRLVRANLPNVTKIDSYIFRGCNALTEIHFATANEEAIRKHSEFSTNFGATNATIYFDL